jgi:hypothetical protein
MSLRITHLSNKQQLYMVFSHWFGHHLCMDCYYVKYIMSERGLYNAGCKINDERMLYPDNEPLTCSYWKEQTEEDDDFVIVGDNIIML